MLPWGRCPGAGSAGQALQGKARAVACHTQQVPASSQPSTHLMAEPCSHSGAASGKMDFEKSKTLPGSEGKSEKHACEHPGESRSRVGRLSAPGEPTWSKCGTGSMRKPMLEEAEMS